MGYDLGVDLGTTYTAAAVYRNGTAQIVELGNRSATIPSVVFLTEQGELLTGEAANRRASTEPSRVAREFKRRTGDPTPLLLGGSPHSAESLSARLLEWVIARVIEREGSAPDRIAVTHPANWGPYKLDLLHQAFRLAGLEDVVTLTEPEAAAIHYATLERVEVGSVVAVFDLGGGTFDAAILRKTEMGFDFLGRPEGIERLGGIDFDEAVFGFVARALGPGFADLDSSDPNVYSAVARLRRDVVEAKEALSSDTDVAIPVMLPNVSSTVRLTRMEFEQLIRPALSDAINTMARAIEGASLEASDVDVVLLVGGSSRIPLVGQLVRSEIGRPVAVDAHPKHSIVLGAALAAASGPQGAHLEAVTGSPVAPLVPPAPPSSVDAQPAPMAATLPVESAAPAATASTTEPAAEPETPAPTISAPESMMHTVSDVGAVAEHPTSADLTVPDIGAYAPPTSGFGKSGADPESAAVSSTAGGIPALGDLDASGFAPAKDGGPNKAFIGAAIVAVVIVGLIGTALATDFFGGGTNDSTAAGEQDDSVPTDDSTPGSVGDETSQSTEPDEQAVESTTTSDTTATSETSVQTASTSTTEPEFTCANNPELKCSKIDDVEVDGGEIVVYWQTNYDQPSLGGFHAHVYYNVWTAQEVGSGWEANGADQRGDWVATSDQPYTTSDVLAVANIPDGATEICVVSANGAHNSVDHENANCVPIPAELLNN